MAYDAFEPMVFPIFILYIILSIFGIFMTIKMILKWKERKVPPPLHLSFVFLCLGLALITLAIGLLEAVITGYYKEIYRISIPLSLSFVVGADIFLFIFASKITERGQKFFIPLIIAGAIIIVVLFLPWNWWGYPAEEYAGKPHIRLYSTLGLVLYSYAIYIAIIIICLKAKKISKDKVAKVGFSLLFYSMIAMICFWVMQVADTIVIALMDHPGYTIFIYIAWVFAVIFSILIYLSLAMPERLVNWIKKRD